MAIFTFEVDKENFLSPEEAGEQFMLIAKAIQRTHGCNSTTSDKKVLQRLFNVRKEGVVALLDLFQTYINQLPEE